MHTVHILHTLNCALALYHLWKTHAYCLIFFLFYFFLSTSMLLQAESFSYYSQALSLSLPTSLSTQLLQPTFMSDGHKDFQIFAFVSLALSNSHTHTHTCMRTCTHTQTKSLCLTWELMHKHTQEEDIKQVCSSLIFY